MNNEILDKFYNIEGEFVNLDLEYNEFNEILDVNFNPKSRKIKASFFNQLYDYIKPLPTYLKLNINLTFKQSDYSETEMKQIFLENVLFNFNNFKRYSKRKVIRSLLMFLSGLIFFMFYYAAKYMSWYEVLIDIFNISAWVFIWEAVTLYFIDLKFDDINFKFFKKRVNEINLKLR